MKNILIAIFLYTFSLNLHASFVASNNKTINPNLSTHVLIAGNPDSLGELFIYSLLTKAKIYLEKSPNEQIIIIGRSDDKQFIKDAGFHILNNKFGLLKAGAIKDAIKNIKQISSVDIYAHSNALSGASLDTNTWIYQILNEKDDLWDEIAKKITKSSFIFIHGCNAGIKFAPLLAKKLQIAVMAAVTSTDFQFIYQDSFWAFDYNAEKNKKSPKNILNYSSPKSCGMYCTRMKPDNTAYRGHWGDWTAGGYPTFKLFCGSNDNEKCELGALEAIYSFPSIQKYEQTKLSLNNFKNQLVDFMCPFSHDSEKQKECRTNLDNSLVTEGTSNYSPFKGKTLVCDRVRCKAHFNCSSVNAAFNPGNCSLESETEDDSTTFTDEYKFFISIFNKHLSKQ